MSEIAKAAQEAGLPDADRLTGEAEEYRQCILDVAKQEKFIDKASGLPLVPNMVDYQNKHKHNPYWIGNGPINLYHRRPHHG